MFSKFFILFNIVLLSDVAFSYPDFIGIGYRSCLTCHYNASGGGPLTDYGRSLFAVEVAGKNFWSAKPPTDDELGEQSGFLGTNSDALPAWLKPYAKYRGLYFKSSTNGSTVEKTINMQADFGTTIVPSPKSPWLFSGALGLVPVPQGASKTQPNQSKKFISREYYARYEVAKKNWIYAGFLDKVYGIKTPDHTAYSRQLTATTQNDQAHSVMWHSSFGLNDLFVQFSFGNLEQSKDTRQKGAGVWYEQALSENTTLGASTFVTKDDYVQRSNFALFNRNKIGKGNSIMFEAGVAKTTPTTGAKVKTAGYGLAEGLIRIIRGYNFLSVMEYSKNDLVGSEADKLRLSAGFLIFPQQRYELRAQYVLGRQIDATRTPSDSKSIQVQLHVSL